MDHSPPSPALAKKKSIPAIVVAFALASFPTHCWPLVNSHKAKLGNLAIQAMLTYTFTLARQKEEGFFLDTNTELGTW